MLLYYFILAILIGLGIVILNKKKWTISLMILFLILQIAFTIYSFFHINSKDLIYFTYDSLAVIFQTILTILTIATTYHGFINLKNEINNRYSYYHAGLICLVVAISGAYLASNIAVAWVFIEATTLSVSFLIYHDRTKKALEATWKYIFVCSTGIALAFMGILFVIQGLG